MVTVQGKTTAQCPLSRCASRDAHTEEDGSVLTYGCCADRAAFLQHVNEGVPSGKCHAHWMIAVCEQVQTSLKSPFHF